MSSLPGTGGPARRLRPAKGERAMKGVFWFLCGGREAASARLQGYLIHEALQELGWNSQIVFRPDGDFTHDLPRFLRYPKTLDLTDTVAVIQKLQGPRTDRLIRWLQQQNSRVVYVNCDRQPQNRSWVGADLVLATSEELCQYHREEGAPAVHLIGEPFEFCHDPRSKPPVAGRLQAVWFGYAENWPPLEPWKKILETEYAATIELITCSNHPAATHPWSAARQRRLLEAADFVLLPTAASDAFKAKSPNRLIQAMAAGLPVIMGALPAFQKIKAQAPFLLEAADAPQFRAALDKILDPQARKTMAVAGFEFATARFAPQAVARHWADLLNLTAADPAGTAGFESTGERLRKIFLLGGKLRAVKNQILQMSGRLKPRA
jgi:hypothetical protein